MKIQKISKSCFLDLHKNKKLYLLTSVYNKDIKALYRDILKVKDNLSEYLKELSNIGNIYSDDIVKTSVYQKDKFIFVISEIDNSKDKNCSWNTKTNNIIVYVKK